VHLTDSSPRRPAKSHHWLLTSAIALLIGLALFAGGYVLINQQRERGIREEYDRATQFYDQGDWEKALTTFDRILALAPNYEDVSFRKNEAIRLRDLDRLYNEGKTRYDAGDTAQAITFLSQLQSQDSTYKQPSVSEMLCDAYYRQAATLSKDVQVKSIEGALMLLNEGAKVCPAHTAILSERNWLQGYLEAVTTLADKRWDKAVAKLSALEEADPTSTDPRIADLLYQAYVGLGQAREEQREFGAALEYYRTAQTVPGVDHTQAAEREQDLAKRMAQMTPIPGTATATRPPANGPTQPAQPTRAVTVEPKQPVQEATPLPVTAVAPSVLTSTATLTATSFLTSTWLFTSTSPLTSTDGFKYAPPKLVGPPQGSIFTAGQWDKITLEWQGPETLADNEYYDVSVLHFYTNQPVYWGTHTREKHLELTPDVGFGQADKDIFHWFVTMRRADRVDKEGKPDGPAISPKSEAWTLVWR